MSNLLSCSMLLYSILLFAGCGEDDVAMPLTAELTNANQLTTYLDEVREEQETPALAALLFRGEEVLYEGYLGMADLEEPRALGARDLFLMASVSKAVTGTALLTLHAEGRFALDDPINDYLPFEVRHPQHPNSSISFRHLLTHTSGIADGPALDDEYYNDRDSPVGLAAYLESYFGPNGSRYDAARNFYAFAPGLEYEYSNTGSALIGYLVEVISGRPFDQYCDETLFEPLGMTATSWRLEGNEPRLVRPYTAARSGFDPTAHYSFTDYPNGGLRSNVRDMHRFAVMLAQDGFAFGEQVLPASIAVDMRTPQTEPLAPGNGLHLFELKNRSGYWGHDGSETGSATIFGFDPSDKTGVILLTNEGDVELEALFAQLMEVAKAWE